MHMFGACSSRRFLLFLLILSAVFILYYTLISPSSSSSSKLLKFRIPLLRQPHDQLEYLPSTAPPTETLPSTPPWSSLQDPVSEEYLSDNRKREDKEEKTEEENRSVNTTVLLNHIRAQCRKNNIPTSWVDPHHPGKSETPRLILTEQQYAILYVSNPKTGSTSFMKFLMRLQGDNRDYDEMEHVHRPKYYHNPQSIQESQYPDLGLGDVIRDKLYCVGFVRNPILRFVSGFRNKVLRMEGSGFNRRIYNALGSHIATEEERFRTFLSLVVSGQITDPHFNPQWRPMRVCSFPYNLLGQVETSHEDIRRMQEDTGTLEFEFPGSRTETGKDNSSTLQEVHKYFDILTESELGDFYEFYKWDFQFLGYTKLDSPNFPYIDLDSENFW